MALTYVCSPLSAPTRAEMLANAAKASTYMMKAEQEFGNRAVAPHAYLPFLSAEIMKAEELGIPVLQRPGLVLEEAPKPVIVGRCINGVTINGLEYLQNDDGEVLYFKGITAAKDYLREHEVTDEEMEDIVLRESVGTCIRCGDPLFPSDISGYAYQCFKCDEDFYAFEQGRNS